MTIDGMLNKLRIAVDGEQWLDFWQKEDIEYGEQLIKALEELRWYREQDLIKRGDCYASFRQASEEVCDICSTARGEICDSCSVTEDLRIISKIPKAEPLKE